jgi:hypothetical protein
MRPRIVNHRKPGLLWRHMLSLRAAMAIVMHPDTARFVIRQRCRVMREEYRPNR